MKTQSFVLTIGVVLLSIGIGMGMLPFTSLPWIIRSSCLFVK